VDNFEETFFGRRENSVAMTVFFYELFEDTMTMTAVKRVDKYCQIVYLK